MLHILLVILKAAGILILSLLAILLILLILVLVVPVRYEADGAFHEKKDVKVVVSWLLHFFSIHILYSEGLTILVKAAGFTVMRKEPEEETELKEESEDEMMEDDQEDLLSESEVIPVDEIPEAKPAETMDLSEMLEEDEKKASERWKEEEKAGKASENRESSEKNTSEPVKKEKPDRIARFRKKLRRWRRFFEDEQTKKMFHLLKKETMILLRHLMPTKCRGEIRYGFDDPYYTGMLLSAISPFYGVYGRSFTIIPEFDQEILEGDLFLRGRISLGLLLYVFLRVMINKRFRYVLKKVRN